MEDADLFTADADPSSEESSKKRKEEEEKWLDTPKLKKQHLHWAFVKLLRQVSQRRQRGPDGLHDCLSSANDGKLKPTVWPGDIPPRILQMMNRPEHVGHSSSANKANYLKPILCSLDYCKPSLQKMNPPEEEENAGTSTSENSRFVWTLERHIKFLQAMHQFGLDVAC